LNRASQLCATVFAWQQMQIATEATVARPAGTASLAAMKLHEADDSVRLTGTDFAIEFSSPAGTLRSLVYSGREMLARPNLEPAGPVLQLYRAPTDNDRGFGRWLARDWRQAGIDQLSRAAWSQSGLGNGSCGPGVLEKYAVLPKSYQLNVRIEPAR
jgi:hypothetical protein